MFKIIYYVANSERTKTKKQVLRNQKQKNKQYTQIYMIYFYAQGLRYKTIAFLGTALTQYLHAPKQKKVLYLCLLRTWQPFPQRTGAS